jgi:hypothetical protein
MDGSEILIEVRPDPALGGNLAGQSFDEKLAARVKEIGASIADMANMFRGELDEKVAQAQESTWGLDEVQLTFSLDVQTETGVIIARASTKAAFEVSFTWARQK